MARRALPSLALAMAALAAVRLPIAIVRRCRAPAGETPPPPPPPRNTPLPPLHSDVAAMFGAMCRHQVTCGVGALDRCTYIEDTMRKLPAKLAIRPCDGLDVAEARRCIEELATRGCTDRTTSLDVLALQTALDRVQPCRLACAPTASSP